MISLEQTVIYKDAEGNTTEITAYGDGERVYIPVPENTVMAVDYAKDSVEGMDAQVVIMPTEEEDGTVVIPEDTVHIIAEYGYLASVTARNGTMSVTIDNDVLKNLSGNRGDVVLSIKPVTEYNTTGAQWKVIGDNYAVSVTLLQNDTLISELGGTAEIEVEPGYEAMHVYYVADDGNLEEIPCTYDSETGIVAFSVVHFSVYMATNGEYWAGPSQMWVMMLPLIPITFLALMFAGIRRVEDEQS
ncbi:hypothetical protein AUP07_0490 [methanogenic archaeon mixed culture ISO4-G1]|nr:hypothetical protein AUP07_0490 [methanogenic archaeon mixed culture ISO4-G1]